MFEKFYGTLNLDNIEQVFEMFKKQLMGKRYIFISVNGGYSFQSSVDVRKDCELNDDGIFYNVDDKDEHKGFHFSDGYVWGLYTTRANAGYDPEFDSPYVVIRDGEIEITHKAPAGHKLHWRIVVNSQDK